MHISSVGVDKFRLTVTVSNVEILLCNFVHFSAFSIEMPRGYCHICDTVKLLIEAPGF